MLPDLQVSAAAARVGRVGRGSAPGRPAALRENENGLDFNSLGAVSKERRNVVDAPWLRKKPDPRRRERVVPTDRLTTPPRIRYLALVPNAHPTSKEAADGRLVLASGSPRRSQILGDAGIDFQVHVSGIDERTRPDESPGDLVVRLACEKCLDVARRRDDVPPRPVLGADTIVVAGEEVLGKPRDEDHAVELVSRLVGTTHRVMTGVAIAWTDGRGPWTEVVTSHVEMRPASRAEVEEYVAVGESLDKAGGYALQGEGARFVVSVRGSRTNVIGLPLEETLALLTEAGVSGLAGER